MLNAVSEPAARTSPAVRSEKPQDGSGNRYLVITTCSAGKRIKGTPSAARFEGGRQKDVASQWLAMLAEETRILRARDLYKGRAFGLARDAAAEMGADMGILSAGLGFVEADVAIPGYDLTVRQGAPGSVAQFVEGVFDPKSWWSGVQRGPYASDLVAAAEDYDGIFVALSKSYLDMVVGDLLSIEAKFPGRLRLFGQSLDRHLPPALSEAYIRYDERLDRIGSRGTRTDFAARALKDFILHCVPAAGRGEQNHAVEARLSTAPPAPQRSPRTRADDAQLCEEIRVFLSGESRSEGRALAWLRAERGFSCEQRRFTRLFRATELEIRQ